MQPSPRIDSAEAIAAHIDALVGLDPRLAPVRDFSGPVPPRTHPSGFAGIAKVITGQQVSVASASAIWSRFAQLPGALDPITYLALSEEEVRGVGFSGSKFRTVRAIAEAMIAGQLDFDHLETLPVEDAVRYLVAHKGIGPWTAEVYLMFCAGHPDIFPAHDVALQTAVGHALAIEPRPDAKSLYRIAESWTPWRGVAARLFWAYYRELRGRDAAPPTETAKKAAKTA